MVHEAGALHELECDILRTLLYGDIFRFPMTAREIHHFLITTSPCSLNDVETALQCSDILLARLERHGEWYVLAGRGDCVAERSRREAASEHLMVQARRYGRWLARLPFVRSVILTGALAMRNAAHTHDDLDFLLVTTVGRVWMARLFAILVVRLARLRGVTVCPNYVLAESALTQDRQDLYIAHELAQMVPLSGVECYAALHDANPWMTSFLANADGPFHTEPEIAPGRLARAAQRLTEWVLGGRLGDRLETWERQRKTRKFQAQAPEPGPGARLDETRVKGHFRDHGEYVLREYEARLRSFGLIPGRDSDGG